MTALQDKCICTEMLCCLIRHRENLQGSITVVFTQKALLPHRENLQGSITVVFTQKALLLYQKKKEVPMQKGSAASSSSINVKWLCYIIKDYSHEQALLYLFRQSYSRGKALLYQRYPP